MLSVAAAAIAISGVTLAALEIRGGSSAPSSAVTALSACRQQPGCHVIRLHDSRGTSPAAVVVNSERAALVPLTMDDAPAGRTYALWQLPRDGGPILVAEFRDASRQTASTALPSPSADTAAFAVSIESVRSTPSRPTHVLAVGPAA